MKVLEEMDWSDFLWRDSSILGCRVDGCLGCSEPHKKMVCLADFNLPVVVSSN